MDIVLRYRGREINAVDVAFINELIAEHPKDTRRALSHKVCEAWEWRQPNGALCDAVCRSLLLALDRSGHISLPPPRFAFDPAKRKRASSEEVEIDQGPIVTSLSGLGSLDLRQVRRTPEEALFEALIDRHHYLGYTRPVGEHLKHMVFAGARPIACFAWSSAPRHLGPRDRYIGWSAEARQQNMRFVAYNSRFLIMPWVRVRHLASHLLGWMTRVLPAQWEHVYNHPVYFAETFVDYELYPGTCYYAANWVCMGRTTGRGKDDQTKRPNRSLKDVLGLPLVRDFRERLGRVS